jgi:dipeptidyl aminopeptidase/acylaminoacyl peptidase
MRDGGLPSIAARTGIVLPVVLLLTGSAQGPSAFEIEDVYRLRSVAEVQLSPDGTRAAYTVSSADRPGRPYSQIWIADVSSGRSTRLEEGDSGSAPRWSPDGKRLAYFGKGPEGAGLLVTDIGTSVTTYLGPIEGTNHPLPSSGERISWAPDGKRLAFVSTTPGPEADANGDPMVITRYLYKPTATEGETRFNDNRRTHIFVADLRSGNARQVTSGNYYEHSIDWSPTGNEILFVSNRGPDPDRFFNYDVFTVHLPSGDVRRLTDTKSAEYYPKWSPDGRSIAFSGTTRPLTSSETTMEDTHVWVMNGDGSGRREVGARIDNRQGAPGWTDDGSQLLFTVQERGSVTLWSAGLACASTTEKCVSHAVNERGSIGSWSTSGRRIAYALATPGAPADLYVSEKGRSRPLTTLNGDLLPRRRIAPVEAFTFKSFDGTEIEAFLTHPLDRHAMTTSGATGSATTSSATTSIVATPTIATTRSPMIVMIHGGPHAQQGPAFNVKAQIYAAHGWATLMVNYRGSTGYGQKLADAIFQDQNGGEARDVSAGVDAALAKYTWLDSDRIGIEGGSYGGQLTNWLITQTTRFKAAIPSAGISNLVSFNYMAYYHDYLAVEFGTFPHERSLMDLLWQRSPIRYVHKVRTPTLFLHGENDNDVPIAEAEQFFIALMDVGVKTEMVRYPREGHGIRETRHVADSIERSIRWYEKHFSGS